MRLIRPQRSASASSILRPVKSHSIAIAGGTICGSITEAMCAPMPRLASGSARCAVSAATRRSHDSASSQPPATAGPFRMAMIGFLQSIIVSNSVRSASASGPR